jgi:hypothetical protein
VLAPGPVELGYGDEGKTLPVMLYFIRFQPVFESDSGMTLFM